ncbi:fibronectin type III domain-containing protein [Candidatus Micrarchaeota archaeon]|nr:fibronectin type III domain-containing protein [Candidatus Micrarchaeota archaeon]
MAKNNSFFGINKDDGFVIILALFALTVISGIFIAFPLSDSEGEMSVSYFSALVSNGNIQLNWNASEDPTILGYNLYRSSEDGSLGDEIANLSTSETTFSEELEPGTYYYTIRAFDNQSDDGNVKQLMVVVTETEEPSMSLTINNGEEYTNSRTVTLELSAPGADECRLRNSGEDWTDWESYDSGKRSWQLSEEQGEKTVEYQCKNEDGDSSVSSSITLDNQPPKFYMLATPQKQEITIRIVVFDENPNTYVNCALEVDGQPDAVFEVEISEEGKGNYIHTSSISSGSHQFSVNCSDEFGNAKKTGEYSITVK